MERIIQTQRVVVAANASARATFAPPYAGVARRWKVLNISLLPNETSAVDATHYADITPKRGATALATAHTTSTTALTQDTPVDMTITGTPSQLEITRAAPLHVLVDATPGNGVAVDVSIQVEFEEMR
jgi:hypothetical protein